MDTRKYNDCMIEIVWIVVAITLILNGCVWSRPYEYLFYFFYTVHMCFMLYW